MLATKANVYFEPPSGELGNRHVGIFYFKKGDTDMKCEVEMMNLFGMTVEEVQDDVVAQINTKMCADFPYDELLTITALEPRASMQQSAQNATDDLARVIVQEAKKLGPTVDLNPNNASSETWPQVVERFYKTFVENNPWEGANGETKNVAIGNIPAFFEPVVRTFLERGYREGYRDAMVGARKAFIQRVEQRIADIRHVSVDAPNELWAILKWLER